MCGCVTRLSKTHMWTVGCSRAHENGLFCVCGLPCSETLGTEIAPVVRCEGACARGVWNSTALVKTMIAYLILKDLTGTCFAILLLLTNGLKPHFSHLTVSPVTSQVLSSLLKTDLCDQCKSLSPYPSRIPCVFLPTPSIFPSVSAFSYTLFPEWLGSPCSCPARRWPWASL